MRIGMLAAGAALASLAAAGAAAKRDVPEIAAIARCRAISEASARLACYDTAVARLTSAVESRDLLVLDRTEVRETRKGLFGFAMPKLALFGGGDSERGKDRDEPLDEITATTKSVRDIGYGKWQIVLEDGAVWVTTDPVTRKNPRAGDSVRIKRGALGSYNIFIANAPSVKGKRAN